MKLWGSVANTQRTGLTYTKFKMIGMEKSKWKSISNAGSVPVVEWMKHT